MSMWTDLPRVAKMIAVAGAAVAVLGWVLSRLGARFEAPLALGFALGLAVANGAWISLWRRTEQRRTLG